MRGFGLALAMMACAIALQTEAATPLAPATASAVRKAALRYDVAGIAPLPFVRGTVGREPTWMLLDTGAATHVATAAIVKRAGLRTSGAGDDIDDHAQGTLASTVTDLAHVALEGWGKMPAGKLLVIEQDGASLATKANVGVFLSPQRIDEGHIVILDLRVAELRIADELDVQRTMATRGKDLLGQGVRTCNGVFVIPARVEGQSADLLLDTGATRTALYETAAASKLLAPRATKSSLNGETPSGKVASRTVRAVRLEASDWQTTSDVELIGGKAPEGCTSDGVLGFSALRSCVLVFGPKRGQLRAKC
ncbi:aspartyl protease family protein [Pendulispora albinea]|uniref:Retroviral-like aspartic protease family protein n=1 Tax=Pendulispora albinea TaxID=2741071 RepID=A0ABZ2LUR3_9BACT